MIKFCRVLAIVAFMSLAACTTLTKNTQDLQKAEGLYQDSNYEASFKSLLPLAREGDAKAQYALGYMYYYGKGIKQDLTLAKIWMRNAAKQAYAPARKALAVISNYDSTFVATTPRMHIAPATALKEPSDAGEPQSALPPPSASE